MSPSRGRTSRIVIGIDSVRGEERGVRRKHHELHAWQLAIELVKEVYALSEKFPRDEAYGLTAQVRRAAISIPSNIAEGAARATDREFLYFLHVSRGSLSELETQIVLAKELGFLKESERVDQLIENVFSKLGGLIKAKKVKE
ncbi:MAG: four helix bundle protein [Betaproteobacteria bacterium]|nr:four helix bundle protein [Betaproteobacteria bacterium]